MTVEQHQAATATASSPVTASLPITSLVAAVALIAIVGLSLSLTIPLLSLEMTRMGISGRDIGLNTAVSGLASIFIIPYVPAIAARVGVGRVIGAALLLSVGSILAFKLVFDYRAWFVIRFAYSLSLGTLFVLSEFWIASIAPAERRGFVMGIYATVLAVGFAAGPSLLAIVGTTGWPPYLAGTALLAIASIPPFLARAQVPALAAAPRHGVARYMRAVPLASAAGIASGAVETGGFSLLPVYGVGLGYDAATAALLVSAIAFGNVLSQIPLGLLADRFPKARVLAVVAGLGLLGSAALPFAAAAGTLPLFALLIAWGGVYGGLYTVGLALLSERYQGSELAGGNAAFTVLFNAGLLLGPPIAGAGFDYSNSYGFPIAMALFFALVTATWTITRRPQTN